MVELLDLFNAYRVPTQHLTSILLAVAVFRWGGAPERWLIGVFIATMVAPVYIVKWIGLNSWALGPSAAAAFVIDLLAATLFTNIALNANRNYPLLVAGFQLVAVGAHIVRSMVSSVSPLAIAVLVIGPSYCQLLVLIGGFARHAVRQRRFGPYREWRLGGHGALGWPT